MKALKQLFLAALLISASAGLRADEEQDLIALLQSNAGVPAKCDACQRLRVVGTAKAIPALAAQLSEERVGHAARYALAGMPYPEAGAALRQALGTTAGTARAGIADALGWCGDPVAVPLLVPLVTDADPAIATAAALALGRLGGAEAAKALTAARDRAPAAARLAVLEGTLLCASRSLAAGDPAATVALVKDLVSAPVPDAVRPGAWRLLVLAEPVSRVALVSGALTGPDAILRTTALRVLRELDDAAVTQACLAKWSELGEAGQLAVLDASLKLQPAAMAAIRRGIGSPYLAVRVAAWQALGDGGDASFVPALAKAAAVGEAVERAAARDTLARLRGDGVREALLQQLDTAPDAEKSELLRVLGERGDAASAPVLLQYAGSGTAALRVAALDSLRRLALAETLPPLLTLAARPGADADPEPVLQALFAVCQTSRDKEQTTRVVVEALRGFPPAGRRQVLPLLPELGTPAALEAALAATRDSDPELVKEAVRMLGQWPGPAPAPRLLELAQGGGDAALQALALRSFVEVAALEPQLPARYALLRQALAAAQRPEERRQVLGQLAQVPTADALRLVLPSLEDAALANEAGLAAVTLAEKIKASDPALAAEAAARVLARCQNPDLVKRAWALRGGKVGGGPFIQDWVVAGPYRQAGANDALSLFNLALGPEKVGEVVAWKPVPRADMVPLSSLYPDQVACVAYLKTTVVAPKETEALLLLGSDDGIKAWVNGAVVHANNVDRGAVADQDMVPVHLKAGANELLLKVTQGGGGWAACARLVSPEGAALPDLKYQAAP